MRRLLRTLWRELLGKPGSRRNPHVVVADMKVWTAPARTPFPPVDAPVLPPWEGSA